ncbi:hypothetical protein GCM10010207_87110 [Streptomyces atratus]|nr:hypothetical protein GCM10010207_87110 [Streptomyces atratus]
MQFGLAFQMGAEGAPVDVVNVLMGVAVSVVVHEVLRSREDGLSEQRERGAANRRPTVSPGERGLARPSAALSSVADDNAYVMACRAGTSPGRG